MMTGFILPPLTNGDRSAWLAELTELQTRLTDECQNDRSEMAGFLKLFDKALESRLCHSGEACRLWHYTAETWPAIFAKAQYRVFVILYNAALVNAILLNKEQRRYLNSLEWLWGEIRTRRETNPEKDYLVGAYAVLVSNYIHQLLIDCSRIHDYQAYEQNPKNSYYSTYLTQRQISTGVQIRIDTKNLFNAIRELQIIIFGIQIIEGEERILDE